MGYLVSYQGSMEQTFKPGTKYVNIAVFMFYQ